MAFRSKRRKPRVVWLPQWTEDRIGTSVVTNGNQNSPGYYSIPYVGGLGNRSDAVFPVVLDYQSSVGISAPGVENLSDLYNSSYRLRRIVGQLHVSHVQTAIGAGPFEDNPTAALVTVGFIVLRVNPESQEPLDAAASRYSLQSLDNTRDPWIWRRSWMLADRTLWAANQLGGSAGAYLAYSGEFGDVRSGPHVDAKTARVISTEERLFMVVTIIAQNGAGPGFGAYIDIVTDLRFLASLRSNVGNRGNSSR